MRRNIAAYGVFVLTVAGGCFCNGLTVFAQHKPVARTAIRFVAKDWNTVLALSRSQRKLIFVDAYAVWCAPCQEMRARTFTDPGVAAYFNRHFINVAMDIEKGEGLKFAGDYAVNDYPTLLFIDGRGRLVKKAEGFLGPAELTKMAMEVKYGPSQ